MDEYLDAKMQQEEINRNNAELVLRPKFIPIYPHLLKDLTMIETALYGFIEFFLMNNDKFYCTNKQLADLLKVGERSIRVAINRLVDLKMIRVSYTIKAGGGTIRFIEITKSATLDGSICHSERSNLPPIYNNIIDNKKEDINTLNNNISLVPEKNKRGSLLKKDPSTDLSTLGPVPSEAKEFLSDSYNKYPSIRYQIDKQGDKYLVDTIKDRNKLCKEYGEETVKTVLNFIKQDDFRCKQIQSIGKLRKKNKDGVPYIVVIMDKITQYKPKIIDLDNM